MRNLREVRFLLRVVSVVLPLALVGCVPYQTYEKQKNEYERLKSAHEDLVVKYNRAIQDILRLQGASAEKDAAQAKAANLEQLNKDLEKRLLQLGKIRISDEDAARLPPEIEVDKKTGELAIGDDVLFNSGEARFKNREVEKILDKLMDLLQANHPNDTIHISGHTDSDPVKRVAGIYKDNQRLGYERAYTVYNYFRDKGIPEDRMILHSFSYNEPRDPANKAKNRRVSFAISAGSKI